MKHLTLVPIKQVSVSKSRLRHSGFLTDDDIQILVSRMFNHVIDCIKEFSPFGVISPDPSLLEDAKAKGATFIYQDYGYDLNLSLDAALQSMWEMKSNWESVLILMADLPLLTTKEYEKMLNRFLAEGNVGLVPADKEFSPTTGTSGLFIPRRWKEYIGLAFGKNSFSAFVTQFKQSGIPYAIHSSLLGYDVDTFDDLKFVTQLGMPSIKGSPSFVRGNNE